MRISDWSSDVCSSDLTTLISAGALSGDDVWVQVLILLGNSAVALLITVIVATIVFGFRRGENGSALEKTVDHALGPVAWRSEVRRGGKEGVSRRRSRWSPLHEKNTTQKLNYDPN